MIKWLRSLNNICFSTRETDLSFLSARRKKNGTRISDGCFVVRGEDFFYVVKALLLFYVHLLFKSHKSDGISFVILDPRLGAVSNHGPTMTPHPSRARRSQTDSTFPPTVALCRSHSCF